MNNTNKLAHENCEKETDKIYLLRSCRRDDDRAVSHGGYVYPQTVGAVVDAQDWDPRPHCGGGLHGFAGGEGDGSLAAWSDDAVWLLIECDASDVVAVDSKKSKFRRGVIVAAGDRKSVTDECQRRCPESRAIVGAFVTSGDGGTSTSGDYGTSTSGAHGTSTSGAHGTSTSGAHGTSTSGDRGTSTSGDGGTSTSGYHGTSTSGDRGTSTSGDYGTSTSGDGGTSTSGDGGTSTSGAHGTSTSGYGGTSISGYGGTSISGYGGTSTSGAHGTSISGYGGTSISGKGGIMQIAYRDKRGRRRIKVGYVGAGGIKPGVRYELDNQRQFKAVGND